MARATIGDLNSSTDNWYIQVRICRMWEAIDFKNDDEVFALELVFADEKGDSIQAYVRKNHIARFKSLFKENEVYDIRNFKVSTASTQYKVVPNKLRIYLNVTTSVRVVSAPSDHIPEHVFFFAPLAEVEERVGNNTLLTDILGCVVTVGPTEIVATGPKREIELQTKTHGVMRVTLWGKTTSALDLSPYNVDTNPVIVVITSTTIRRFKGDLSYNSTTASRIYYNLNRPDVTALGKIFAIEYKGIKLLGHEADARLSLSEQAALNRVTIAELLAMEWVRENQVIFCTVAVEITEVDQRYGWSYVSCNQCSKRVVPKNGMLLCPACNKPCSTPVIRYKFHVRAKDLSGSATFVIFNDDAEKLIMAPATNFIDRVGAGGKDLPHEIVNLIGQSFIFKLKVTDYNLKDGFENYTVAKIFQEHTVDHKRKATGSHSPLHGIDTSFLETGPSIKQLPPPPIPVTPEKAPSDLKKKKTQ